MLFTRTAKIKLIDVHVKQMIVNDPYASLVSALLAAILTLLVIDIAASVVSFSRRIKKRRQR
jgi:hypothetical protein